MNLTVSQIAALINGKVEGQENIVISGPCKIEEGSPGLITFLAHSKYETHFYSTKASAVIIANDFQPKEHVSASLIRVSDVYGAVAFLLEKFGQRERRNNEIDTLCKISKNTTIGQNVGIGAFTVVSDCCVIGDDTEIDDQVYLGQDVVIGKNCHIYPGVKIYHGTIIGDHVTIHSNAVIGSDGFGFNPDQNGVFQKIAQIGIVRIEDSVEIGSCTVIDRATMGETVIKTGAKIDNLVQLAHNVVIGENTVIAAQTGIAGSTQVGQNCMLGGQVGLAGHIKIADGTMIQAKSGLSSDIKEKNKRWYGYPALDYVSYLRSYSHFKKLPEIVQKLRDLEAKIRNFTDEK